MSLISLKIYIKKITEYFYYNFNGLRVPEVRGIFRINLVIIQSHIVRNVNDRYDPLSLRSINL